MSWAAHNPEKYSEICREGVRNKLYSLSRLWNGFPDDGEYGADELVDMLLERIEHSTDDEILKLWDMLICVSASEISDAHADYFISLIP